MVLTPGGTHWETFYNMTTSNEYMRDAFLILDYSVKAVRGAQYNVLYQDQKEEELVGKDKLLEELADCHPILN
jgi:hypothetical protein